MTEPRRLPPAVHYASLDPQPASNLPGDQAQGLRQLFSGRAQRFVPIVSNPAILFGGVVLERLCSAWSELGLHTLVVDASERSGPPKELAIFDLSEGIEPLSKQVSYLSAKGLPLRHVDMQGTSVSFLDALAQAAPQSDVILIHASASELSRIFGPAARQHDAQRLCPAVLVDDQAEALTQAYAGIKVLSTRAGLLAHNLIICASVRDKLARHLAQRLATCADSFLGAAQRSWIAIDPMTPATAPLTTELSRYARELLDASLAYRTSPSAHWTTNSLPSMAWPATHTPVLN